MDHKKPESPDANSATVRTPPPESSATRVSGERQYTVVDLTSDPLLRNVPRTTFQGQTVPMLGGIPLLDKLGQGGMGAVYRGVRTMLQQEVAVKVLPLHGAARMEGLTDRFVREAQIAARIDSNNLVRVTDVNEFEGLFYLIMDYVPGPSAARLIKDQKQRGQHGMDEASALDICIAACRGLAAAHMQGVIHRDVKPDNILIPRTADGQLLLASAKLADLGLARKEEGEASLTASNIGLGTPGYMAPEQAMSARHAGKPADVFGMGATLYALLSGHAPFSGESAASIIIATVQQPHPPIRNERADVSEATARLLDQCLAKNPPDRYTDAPALLEALQVCRRALTDSQARSTAIVKLDDLKNRTEVGEPVPVSTPATQVDAAATVVVAKKRNFAIPLIVAIVLATLAALAWFNRSRVFAPVSVGIACAPEQAEWLKWSAQEFAKTDAGKGKTIRLIPMGSQDAQTALLNGNHDINVWLSMSALTRPVFEKNWKSKYGNDAIARAELLGVTPHAFLIVKSRYDAFFKKYGELTFPTLRAGLNEAGGWAAIANQPRWGRFTFAFTNPALYSSGLTSLALIAFDLRQKDGGLTAADVNTGDFDQWVRGFERAFSIEGNSDQVLQTFVLKGPSAYDGVFTYESSILEQIDDAEDRWGPMHLVYPHYNIWNESTYFVLNAPWTTPKSKKLANDFADFLISPVAQKQLVIYGFRPANSRVKIQFEGSPFKEFRDRGVLTEMPTTVDPPSAEALAALLREAKTLEPAR